MLDQLQSGDWEEAFDCAARDQPMGPQPTQGYTGSVERFTRDDVAEVIAMSDGANDEASWVGVFRLHDGRFVFLSAWCDYTGWGCQDGGQAWVAADLPSLIRWGLPQEARERLNLPLRP